MLILSVLLGGYVLFEGLLACCALEPGLKHFCTKAKYVSSATAGPALAGVMLFYPLPAFVEAVILLSLVALALCVWPRMVFRVRAIIDSVPFGESQ